MGKELSFDKRIEKKMQMVNEISGIIGSFVCHMSEREIEDLHKQAVEMNKKQIETIRENVHTLIDGIFNKTSGANENKKEFHLWCNHDSDVTQNCILHTVHEVEEAISLGICFINTTQVCTVSTILFDKGYRIFVHDRYGKSFEITLGGCERTDKEIRMAHNLSKMLENGAFGDVL